jgi:acetyl esterase/lipase
MARFLPRGLVTRTTLPVMQRLTEWQGRAAPKDVEVLTLTSGTGVRLFRPADVTAPGPALLWIHGGGYVLGSPAQDDALCRRFVAELGVTVAAVKYRLAPQNPYPAGLEDCYSALAWLAALPAVDPTRVAIAGASAGGGLAAALALLARSR